MHVSFFFPKPPHSLVPTLISSARHLVFGLMASSFPVAYMPSDPCQLNPTPTITSIHVSFVLSFSITSLLLSGYSASLLPFGQVLPIWHQKVLRQSFPTRYPSVLHFHFHAFIDSSFRLIHFARVSTILVFVCCPTSLELVLQGAVYFHRYPLLSSGHFCLFLWFVGSYWFLSPAVLLVHNPQLHDVVFLIFPFRLSQIFWTTQIPCAGPALCPFVPVFLWVQMLADLCTLSSIYPPIFFFVSLSVESPANTWWSALMLSPFPFWITPPCFQSSLDGSATSSKKHMSFLHSFFFALLRIFYGSRFFRSYLCIAIASPIFSASTFYLADPPFPKTTPLVFLLTIRVHRLHPFLCTPR